MYFRSKLYESYNERVKLGADLERERCSEGDKGESDRVLLSFSSLE